MSSCLKIMIKSSTAQFSAKAIFVLRPYLHLLFSGVQDGFE